jgi:hypothetical protein
MLKFGLFCELPGRPEGYLVPSLLKEMEGKADFQNPACAVFKFDLLPGGEPLFHRLVCAALQASQDEHATVSKSWFRLSIVEDGVDLDLRLELDPGRKWISLVCRKHQRPWRALAHVEDWMTQVKKRFLPSIEYEVNFRTAKGCVEKSHKLCDRLRKTEEKIIRVKQDKLVVEDCAVWLQPAYLAKRPASTWQCWDVVAWCASLGLDADDLDKVRQNKGWRGANLSKLDEDELSVLSPSGRSKFRKGLAAICEAVAPPQPPPAEPPSAAPPSDAEIWQAIPEIAYADLVYTGPKRPLKPGLGGSQGYVRPAKFKGTKVAVKFPGTADGQGTVEDKRDELRAEAIRYGRFRMQHPRLVTLIGRSPTPADGEWVLVLEFGGKSLREKLDELDQQLKDLNNHAEQWPVRLQLAVGCASALEAVHGNGMAHCDVAGRNFLVCDQNGWEKIIICDLGLARSLGGADDQRILPCTAAPEIYDDQSPLYTGEITTRSDIFSFGLLLLELLGCADPDSHTKIPPFPGLQGCAGFAFKQYCALIEKCRLAVPDNRPGKMELVRQRLEFMQESMA